MQINSCRVQLEYLPSSKNGKSKFVRQQKKTWDDDTSEKMKLKQNNISKKLVPLFPPKKKETATNATKRFYFDRISEK